MRVSVNGVQQGGSAGIPGTPAEVLLDAAEPNSIVTLDASGVGGTIPQSSIPTLPATPASVLLNASAPSTIVALNSSGLGTELTYAATRTAIAATPGATIVDPLTGADWTATEPAGLSFVWSTGVSLTTSGAGGSTGNGNVTRAAVLDSGAQEWDWAVRVQVTAGDASQTTSTHGYILLQMGIGSSQYVSSILYASGHYVIFHNVGAGLVNSGPLTPAPSAGQRTGGDLWMRVHGDVFGRWSASWGVGSAGALPTAWQRVWTLDSATLSGYAMATSGLTIINGSSGGAVRTATHTVVVHAIRSTWSGTL